MNISSKIRDLTLKSMIILVTYIAGLILCLIYFDHIVGFIGTILSVIRPFIIGIILTFIFNIPMKYFIKKIPIENEKKKKTIAAFLSVSLIFLIIFVIIIVIIPQVIENLKTLVNNLPQIIETVEEWIIYFSNQVHISNDIVVRIEEFQQGFGSGLLEKISSWGPSIAIGVTNITTGIVHLLMGFVMSIYMLFSKDKLIRQVKKIGQAILNDKQMQSVTEVVHLILVTFENFLGGQLTESVIIGVLCYIGCMFLKIPYASIAALLIGFTNIIPYFGPIIGAFLSCILIVFVSPIKAIVFLVFSTLLQQFESNLIYPHVVGGSVGLSALWVLFAVTVGGGLFGIAGMVFGLPTFSVIYELLRRWINQRIEEKEELKKIEKSV